VNKEKLLKHLRKLATEARRRTSTNKRFDARLRARGEQLAYENAVECVALLEQVKE